MSQAKPAKAKRPFVQAAVTEVEVPKAQATEQQAPVAKALEAKAPVAAAAKINQPIATAAAETSAIAQAAVEAAEKNIESTIKQGNEQMNQQTNQAFETPEVAADRMHAAFGDVSERARTAVERTTKIVEEMADLTRGNVEALVASSRVAVKGVETIGQEAAEYGRRSFEEASAALKSFAEAKSPTDFFKLQSDFARSAFDSWVAGSSKASETVLKLAGEVAEPITTRYSVAAERVKNVAL